VWQQFFDLQHGKRAEEEEENQEYDKLSDGEYGEEGAEWFEDTELDKAEYENIMYIDGNNIEEIEEINGKFNKLKGSQISNKTDSR